MLRGFILAAGFGSRLRPWTLTTPKALCPYFGVPLFDLAYLRLLKAGVSDITTNTHYLAKKINEHLKVSSVIHELPVRQLHEDTLRGSGGFLANYQKYMKKGDDLLVYNADIVSSVDLLDAYEFHKRKKADATMILLSKHAPSKTPIFVDEHQKICSIGENISHKPRHSFTGIHILSWEFVCSIPKTVPWSIIDTYKARIVEPGNIFAYIAQVDDLWFDLGETPDYLQAHFALLRDDYLDLARRLELVEAWKRKGIEFRYQAHNNSLVSSRLDHSLNLQNCIVTEDACSVQASLDHCVVTDGCTSVVEDMQLAIITKDHCLRAE